jgi:hypothetical protein
VLDHKRTRVIEQDFLGHSAKLREGTFQPIEPALLPFVAESPDVRTSRVAEGGNKQVGAQLRPADLDQALAKIDLHLLARRRLEPHGCSRLCFQLLPVRLHRPLDRAKADGDFFLDCELLAQHVGIPAMTT